MTGSCSSEVGELWYLQNAVTLDDWHRQRAELLGRLQRFYGAMPARGALEVEEYQRREFVTHTEIKLSYAGEPGERIPAYLLLPRNAPCAKQPGILAAHQCAFAWACDVGKEQVVGKCVDWPDQAYGLELVREGFVVLAPDANKVGERYNPSLREPWQTAAMLPAGQEACCTAPGGSWGPIRWKPVFNVMRGIDLLAQHPLVNPLRIGMIGHSLGADTLLWSMPLDPRIRTGVISGGGLMGLTGQGATRATALWLSRRLPLPFTDVVRLIAPRAFFEVIGNEDYPSICDDSLKGSDVDARMAAKRAAHEAIGEVYRLYGARERLALYEFDGGHRFPTPARKAAYAWLKRWLKDA